jgi:hypothetical protein
VTTGNWKPDIIFFGASECQLKHWKTRQKGNRNFGSENIRVASFVEGPGLSIGNSKFAGFASGN